jgi:predicted  nucleic acid-binding Zn-ribbon protein
MNSAFVAVPKAGCSAFHYCYSEVQAYSAASAAAPAEAEAEVAAAAEAGAGVADLTAGYAEELAQAHSPVGVQVAADCHLMVCGHCYYCSQA